MKRAVSGRFLLLHEHETDVLDTLPLWMDRLFRMLVRVSDYSSGAGSVAFAQLVLWLTPLQPRRGPRHYAPNLRAIKDAVRGFEQRQLLRRDKALSQGEGLLFFMVSPRLLEVRPTSKLGPQTPTPVDSRKASNGAASSGASAKTPTPNSDPLFKNEFFVKGSADLSTVDNRAALLRTRAELVAKPSKVTR